MEKRERKDIDPILNDKDFSFVVCGGGRILPSRTIQDW